MKPGWRQLSVLGAQPATAAAGMGQRRHREGRAFTWSFRVGKENSSFQTLRGPKPKRHCKWAAHALGSCSPSLLQLTEGTLRHTASHGYRPERSSSSVTQSDSPTHRLFCHLGAGAAGLPAVLPQGLTGTRSPPSLSRPRLAGALTPEGLQREGQLCQRRATLRGQRPPEAHRDKQRV